MMQRLVDFALGRRTLVIALAAAVLVAGFTQAGSARVETLPEFQPTIVEVQTEALGLSAVEVEELITAPLEADLLNGVAWLESIESSSIPGLSSIVMQFEPGTDILNARQVVQERLTQAAGLPNVSRAPAMVQPLSAESRVMLVGLTSEDVSLIDMSVLARWTIRPALMGVEGVANVSIWGQRMRQLQVHADQQELLDNDLTLLEIVKTTGNALWVSPLTYLEASTPGTGGFIDGPNQRIGIQHSLGIETAEDLAAVALEGREGLTLGEVTTVVEDHQPLIGDAILEEGPGLLLVIEKFPWSNTIDTTRAIEATLEELAPGLSGIEVDTGLYRPANYLEQSVANVRVVALGALALIIIAGLALLSGWRTAVVALASLLVSLAAAGLLLLATSTEVTAMILAGLVLAAGLVIDDAISDSETLRRRLSRRREAPAHDVIRAAVIRNRRYPAYAMAALAVAIVPTFVAPGSAGEFLPSIGLTMLGAIVVSMVVAATLTPALASSLLASGAADETWLMTRARRGFARIRQPFASSGRPALIAAVALLAVGAAAVPMTSQDFVPQWQQRDVVIDIDAVAGTSLPEAQRIVSAAAAEIRALPGVDDAGGHTGRAVLSDEVTNVNANQLWVGIEPGADYSATLAAIGEIVSGYPGLSAPGAISYSNMRIDDVLRQPTQDVVARVYGEDPAILAELADEIGELVTGVDGAQNVRVLHPVLEPNVEIAVDLERAAAYGVKPGDVRRTAATLLSGIEVGSFFEQQKVFEVVVWSAPENRHSVSSVENLLIDTPFGGSVKLSEVADVEVAPVQTVIRREAVSRYIDVVADVTGRSAEAVKADINELIQAQGLPFEYHVGVRADVASAAAGTLGVLAVGLAVAVAILLLLQAAFNSWRLAFPLLLLPLVSVAGGLVAVALGGGTLSLGSWVGLFAAWALTLRHGIALYGRYEELQLHEDAVLGPQLIEQGLSDRFAPTVASLAAIFLATIPVLLLGVSSGTEVLQPLALALAGGLVGSAIVSLLLLPAAYARIARPAQEREPLVAT